MCYIDSHMRFVDCWDDIIIRQLEAAEMVEVLMMRRESRRAIVTETPSIVMPPSPSSTMQQLAAVPASTVAAAVATAAPIAPPISDGSSTAISSSVSVNVNSAVGVNDSTRAPLPKVVLTTYPQGYTLVNNNNNDDDDDASGTEVRDNGGDGGRSGRSGSNGGHDGYSCAVPGDGHVPAQIRQLLLAPICRCHTGDVYDAGDEHDDDGHREGAGAGETAAGRPEAAVPTSTRTSAFESARLRIQPHAHPILPSHLRPTVMVRPSPPAAAVGPEGFPRFVGRIVGADGDGDADSDGDEKMTSSDDHVSSGNHGDMNDPAAASGTSSASSDRVRQSNPSRSVCPSCGHPDVVMASGTDTCAADQGRGTTIPFLPFPTRHPFAYAAGCTFARGAFLTEVSASYSLLHPYIGECS